MQNKPAHGWSFLNIHTTFGQMQALFWAEQDMLCTVLKSFAMFLFPWSFIGSQVAQKNR